MAQQKTVVTRERFAQGLTYAQFLAQAKVNVDRFQRWYDAFQLPPEDAEFFRRAVNLPRGPARVLALGEDWCPDVYRGMPVMVKIAEASGMELRVFPRDQHLDIMDQFLYKGQFRSIPTFVFYTRNLEYLCHWIERPVLAYRELEEMEEQIRRTMPNATEEERRAERRRRQDRWPVWQQETVRELREMLAKHVGL